MIATRLAVIFVMVVASCGAALGQESRADEIARLQAEKARVLTPYERSTGEKVLAHANPLLVAANGLYPWMGSVYPGGALGLGAAYRSSLADTGALNVLGGWSLRNYKTGRLDVKLPELAHRRVSISTRAMWLDAPSVAFYGVGNDTRPAARTTYQYSPVAVGLTGTARVAGPFVVGAGAEYLAVDTSTDASGPGAGIGQNVSYVTGRLSLGFDWRPAVGYSRRGGMYRLEWARYDDRENGQFGFRQTEAEIVQLLPLFQESSVIALRALATTTEVDGGHTIPVFMLPSLGGGSTLRGYPSWRFRDRHRLLFSAEYRWTPAQVIDMALFADGGKVAARRSDLDFDGLRTNVGIGIRLHGPSFTALRLDVARGREGWAINVGGGAAF